jgi:hypothetical protein
MEMMLQVSLRQNAADNRLDAGGSLMGNAGGSPQRTIGKSERKGEERRGNHSR